MRNRQFPEVLHWAARSRRACGIVVRLVLASVPDVGFAPQFDDLRLIAFRLLSWIRPAVKEDL